MNKNLKQYASKNSLDFYFNTTNIPNQELVQDTFNYFANGPRKEVFNSLDFLNLLDKQSKFIKGKVNESEFVLAELRAIPFSKLERHILFGFILKWHGGYPVNNFNKDYDRTLKLIEYEFLSYPEDTPEKEFCKADMDYRKYLMKLGIASTTSINTGVSLTKLMEGFEQKKDADGYQNFNSLFEDAAINGLFGVFTNEEQKLIFRTKCNYDFNIWLNENRSWDLVSLEDYKRHLTKECFLQFFDIWDQTQNLLKGNKENYYKRVWAGRSLQDITREVDSLIQTQSEFERPLVEEVERHLQKLQTAKEKIEYLTKQKDKYLTGLPISTFAVSGVTSNFFPAKTELFFDRYISQRISELQRLEAEIDQDRSVTNSPQKFENVFAVADFKKYIAVFEKTKPALLNSNWQFIGNPKKHKGVICSWIRDLQLQSVIRLNISRSELAQVLNNELQDLNLGKDGKTLHNLSAVYKKEFKKQIESLLDMN